MRCQQFRIWSLKLERFSSIGSATRTPFRRMAQIDPRIRLVARANRGRWPNSVARVLGVYPVSNQANGL